MIDLSAPTITVGSTTLLPDHADPARWYALPSVPTLRPAAGGGARASLVLFRASRPRLAGGWLQMESALSLSPEAVEALRGVLRARGLASPQVLSPGFTRGHARVVGWREAAEPGAPDGPPPVVIAETTPSLTGDLGAVFSARLDEAGASLCRAMLQARGLPGALLYELEFVGLAAPLGIEVEVDLHGARERLSAMASFTSKWAQAKVQATLDEMASTELFHVRVVDGRGEAEGARAEALRRVGEDMVRMFFEAMPAPPEVAVGGGAPTGYGALRFSLRQNLQGLEERARWRFTERVAMRVWHAASAALLESVDPGASHGLVRELDDRDVFFQRTDFEYQITDDLGALGVGAVALTVEWDREGDATPPRHEAMLTPTERAGAVTVAVPGDRGFRWRVSVTSADLAWPRQSEWQRGSGALLVASIEDVLPLARWRLVAGRVDWSVVRAVEARVRCAGESRLDRDFTLRAPGAEVTLRYPRERAADARLTVTWRGREGEPTWTDAARSLDDDVVLLDAPWRDPLRITLVPVDGDDVVAIGVEMRREEPASGFNHARVERWEGADRALRSAVLQRLDASTSNWRYRVTREWGDGRVEAGAWAEVEGTVLVFPEVDRDVVAFEVVLLDGPPGSRGALADEVTITVEGADEPVRKVFRGDDDRARCVAMRPRADASKPVRWHATRTTFGDDGSARSQESDGDGALVVV
ncbi:MAG: hypothetical protein U0326_21330 [Polyangiales bacterium]